MLAFYQAASAEVKSHGTQQLVIANPGVVPARQLAQLVNFISLHPPASAGLQASPQRRSRMSPSAHKNRMHCSQADVVLTFEGPYGDWLPTGLPRSGVKQISTSAKTAALVYGGESLDAATLKRQMLRAQILGFSYVYFTDGTMPDPWAKLPAYFDTALTALQASQQQNVTF